VGPGLEERPVRTYRPLLESWTREAYGLHAGGVPETAIRRAKAAQPPGERTVSDTAPRGGYARCHAASRACGTVSSKPDDLSAAFRPWKGDPNGTYHLDQIA